MSSYALQCIKFTHFSFSENVNCVEFIAGPKKIERKANRQQAVQSSPFSKSVRKADWLANKEPRK